MTERKKFDIQETRLEVFSRDIWTCRSCGQSIYRFNTPQVAHGISQSKMNIILYGEKIIHSIHNMYAACSLSCNSALAVGKSLEHFEAERIRKIIEGET